MGKKDHKLWLDDPEWEMLFRKTQKRPISSDLRNRLAAQESQRNSKPNHNEPRPKTTRNDTDKEVVVNLKFSVPKVKLPDFRKDARANKTKILKLASVVVVVVGLIGMYKFMPGLQSADTSKNPSNNPEEKAEGAFTPLVPLEDLTGVGAKQSAPEFKYERDRKVMAFVTEFNGSNLTVSQQALPDQLKTNPGQIEGIARSIDANVPIETQKGKAFIGTDEETKTQIAVFATDETLVFIRSTEELDTDTWEFYINQLVPKKQ